MKNMGMFNDIELKVTWFEASWTFINVLITAFAFMLISLWLPQFSGYFAVNNSAMLMTFVLYTLLSFIFALFHSGELKIVSVLSFIPAIIFSISAALLNVYGMGSMVAAVFGFFISYVVTVIGYMVTAKLFKEDY